MKVTPEIIEEVKKRLVKTYNPLEIYLFGSYAWGVPTQDSDLDLLIVVKQIPQEGHAFHVNGYRALRDLMVAKDLVLYTKEVFEKHAHDVTTLCYKVKKEGRLIYAAA